MGGGIITYFFKNRIFNEPTQSTKENRKRKRYAGEVARRGDVIHSYKYQTSARGDWRDRGARASNR